MSAIKRFFEKKKMDIKFKKAGTGQQLQGGASSSSSARNAGTSAPVPQARPPPVQSQTSREAQRAAEAAMARMNQSATSSEAKFTGTAAIKMQVKKELEAEKRATEKALALAANYQKPAEIEQDAAPVIAVSGILYKCPMIGPQVLPKEEMEKCIEEFLLSQLTEEPAMTAALIIQTLNKDREKVKVCIDTLCKYLDNIMANPGEGKFRKIRINNKAFQERVSELQGSNEFLQAVGFEHKMLPGANEVEESFYVLDDKDPERLQSHREILVAAEPIKPELDRARRVFHPSTKAVQFEVPQDFYNIKPEELKKEQQLKQEAVERFGMLRTKEMREREQQRELRKYRYTAIRTRFPDGTILQGTFRAVDKLAVVFDFVRENLENDWVPFSLSTSTGHKLTSMELSLAELGLAPAVLVNFSWDEDIMKDIAASQGSAQNSFLKQEAMGTIQYL